MEIDPALAADVDSAFPRTIVKPQEAIAALEVTHSLINMFGLDDYHDMFCRSKHDLDDIDDVIEWTQQIFTKFRLWIGQLGIPYLVITYWSPTYNEFKAAKITPLHGHATNK